MKKKLILLLIVLFSFILIPVNTYASKDKVTIYLFRGEGCPHCADFLNFLNDIEPEYAKMFELESYEVWYDSSNRELMTKIAEFLETDVSGVPFIIIGDKTFAGYGTSYDAEIKKTIKSLYETKKNKRYDVMTEYKKKNKLTGTYKSMNFKETLSAEGIEYKTKKSTSVLTNKNVVLWNLAFAVLSTAAIIVFINFKFQKLSENFENTVKKVNKTTKK